MEGAFKFVKCADTLFCNFNSTFFFIFRSLKKCFTKVNFKRVYVSKRKIRINKKSSGLQRYTMHLSVESSVTQTKKNTFRHNFFKKLFFFLLFILSFMPFFKFTTKKTEKKKQEQAREFHQIETSSYWLPKDEDEQLRQTGVSFLYSNDNPILTCTLATFCY